MASTIGDLVVRLGAQTRPAEQKLQTFMQRITNSATRMGNVLATSLGSMASIYGIYRFIKAGEDFNRSMRQSQAIMGELSDDMRNKMRRAAFDVAAATRYSADETAKAFYYLASAGLSAEQSIEALPVVAAFAQAGMFDLSTATTHLMDSMKALGIASQDPQENMARMVWLGDRLVKANTLANASVEQFAEGLSGPLAGALRANNRSIEEGIALLALLAERGIKGQAASEAGMVLYRDIPRALAKNADAWDRYGVAVTDAEGNMLSMGEMLLSLTERLKPLSDVERAAAMDAMGLTRSVRAIVMSLSDGTIALEDFQKALHNAGGTMEEVADKQLTPWQKGWSQFKAGVVESSSALGNTLGPALEDIGGGIAELREAMASLYEMENKLRDTFGLATKEIDKQSFSFQRYMQNLGRFDFLSALGELRKLRETQGLPEGIAPPPPTPSGGDFASVKAQADALDKANETLRQMAMTAEDRALEKFLEPLREAGTPMRELEELAWKFLEAMRQGKEEAQQIPSPLEESRKTAEELLRQWKQDARMADLKGRDRMIEEMAEKLSAEDADVLAGLREWDHKLDEIEKKTQAKDFLEGLANRFKTPQEDAEDMLRKLDEIRRAYPDLAATTGFERAHDELSKLLYGDTPEIEIAQETKKAELQFAGALQKGTTEAYSAILKGLSTMQRGPKPEEQIARNTTDIRRSSQLSTRALEDIRLLLQSSSVEVEPLGIED